VGPGAVLRDALRVGQRCRPRRGSATVFRQRCGLAHASAPRTPVGDGAVPPLAPVDAVGRRARRRPRQHREQRPCCAWMRSTRPLRDAAAVAVEGRRWQRGLDALWVRLPDAPERDSAPTRRRFPTLRRRGRTPPLAWQQPAAVAGVAPIAGRAVRAGDARAAFAWRALAPARDLQAVAPMGAAQHGSARAVHRAAAAA
jgi:hypothetical protein